MELILCKLQVFLSQRLACRAYLVFQTQTVRIHT